jgi:hypothetical protein
MEGGPGQDTASNDDGDDTEPEREHDNRKASDGNRPNVKEGMGDDDDDLGAAPAKKEAAARAAKPAIKSSNDVAGDVPDHSALQRPKRSKYVPAPQLTSSKRFMEADHCKNGRDPLKLLYIKTHKTGSSTLANVFNRLTVKYGRWWGQGRACMLRDPQL